MTTTKTAVAAFSTERSVVESLPRRSRGISGFFWFSRRVQGPDDLTGLMHGFLAFGVR